MHWSPRGRTFALNSIMLISPLFHTKIFLKELVHFFKKLPDTNSSFLDKISSRMVKTNHMKLKKLLSRILSPLHHIRRVLWNPSKKRKFLKIRARIWQNGYIRARILKILAFFAELHADNWSWRKVASTEVQLWLSTYWQPLTISNLILSPKCVLVWPTFWQK